MRNYNYYFKYQCVIEKRNLQFMGTQELFDIFFNLITARDVTSNFKNLVKTKQQLWEDESTNTINLVIN